MKITVFALARLLPALFLAAPAYAQIAEDLPELPPSFELYGKPVYVTIGAGAIGAPAYEGAAAYDLSPIPVVDIRWGRDVFFDLRRGLGANVYRGHGVDASVALGFSRGRDAGADGGLRGMGDVDMAAKPNFEIGYTHGDTGLFFDLRGFTEIDDGARFAGSIGGGWKYLDAQGLRINLRAGLHLADDEYMETYFGVDRTQAARSGYQRFDAGAGLYKTSIDLNASQALSENWNVFGLAGFDYLLGDAADSPINKRRAQARFGAGVTYTF